MKYNPQFEEDAQELIPGEYTARVKSVKDKMSKSGKPMLLWTLEVLNPGFAGKVAWHNTVLQGAGSGMLKHFLKTLDGKYDGGEFDTGAYIGKTVGIRMSESDYGLGIVDVFPSGEASAIDEDDSSDLPF